MEKNTKREALCSVPQTIYYSGDQINNKWTGHVARMAERTGLYKFWFGDLKEREHLKDLGVDGRTIKTDFQEGVGRHGLDCCNSG